MRDKKLVKFNEVEHRYIDVDSVKLRRIAKELKQYLNDHLPQDKDDHNVIGNFLPLCEKAINGEFSETLPPNSLPLEFQRRERVFKEELNQLLAKFCTVLSGLALEEHKIINKNGEVYVEAAFEK